MLRWPSRALGGLVRLFRPLQDVDVYVEDASDEVFYAHFLRRVVGDRARIARVFSLGSRREVIEAARRQASSNSEIRSLYVIDGDFEWVQGVGAPEIAGVYRLNAYCIENFLIEESAAAQVLKEDLVIDEVHARTALNFGAWLRSISDPLVDLFAAWAVANAIVPTLPTTQTGVGRLLSLTSGHSELDPTKASVARDEALAAAIAVVGKQQAMTMYQNIRDRAYALPRPVDIVSGKDFLMPLLDFAFRWHNCRVRRKALRHRLALALDVESLQDLADAIVLTAQGQGWRVHQERDRRPG